MTDLRVLNYNTHLFGENLKSVVADVFAKFGGDVAIYRDDERAGAVVKALSGTKLDIVGLTEVWDDSLAARIRTELAGDFPFQYRPDENDVKAATTGIGSGLLLLSRHRLMFGDERSFKVGSFVGYDDLAASDARSKKGIAVAQVNLSATAHVLVFLTHNQASYGTGEDAHVPQRTSNVAQVRDTIDSYVSIYRQVNAREPAGVVLLGDLNIEAEPGGVASSEYVGLVKQMNAVGLRDAFRTIRSDPKTDPGFTYDATRDSLIPRFSAADTKAKLQQRLDYQFCSAGLVPKGVEIPVFGTADPGQASGKGDVSDHYPVSSIYSIES